MRIEPQRHPGVTFCSADSEVFEPIRTCPENPQYRLIAAAHFLSEAETRDPFAASKDVARTSEHEGFVVRIEAERFGECWVLAKITDDSLPSPPQHNG